MSDLTFAIELSIPLSFMKTLAAFMEANNALNAEMRNAASFRPIARLTLQYMQVRSAKAGRLFISY